eukprot:Hpha_TRINITY_DN13475_c0_g1::TRINITY_DN13475_c0_g1_i1::g.131357::m.131357
MGAGGAKKKPEEEEGGGEGPPEERYRPGTAEEGQPQRPESPAPPPEAEGGEDSAPEIGSPARQTPAGVTSLTSSGERYAPASPAPNEVQAVHWFGTSTVQLKTTPAASKYSHCDFFARFWAPKEQEEEVEVKKMMMHTSRCDVRRRLGRTNEAISELREAVRIADSYGDSARGMAHFELGKLLLWADTTVHERDRGALTREALSDLEDSKFLLLVEIPNDAMGMEREGMEGAPPPPVHNKLAHSKSTNRVGGVSWRSGPSSPTSNPTSPKSPKDRPFGSSPHSSSPPSAAQALKPLNLEGAAHEESPNIAPSDGSDAQRRMSGPRERRNSPARRNSPGGRRLTPPSRRGSDAGDDAMPVGKRTSIIGNSGGPGWFAKPGHNHAQHKATQRQGRRESLARVLQANNAGIGEGHNRQHAPPPVFNAPPDSAPEISLTTEGSGGQTRIFGEKSEEVDELQNSQQHVGAAAWDTTKGTWNRVPDGDRFSYLHLKLCALLETLADTYWTEMRKQEVGSSLRKHYMMQAERSRKALIAELEVIHGKTSRLIGKQWRCLSDFYTETFDFKEADMAFQHYSHIESGNVDDKAVKYWKGTLKKAQKQDLEERAAVRVQAMFRGWLDRRIVTEMKKDKANLRHNPLAVPTVLPFCRTCGCKQGGRFCAGCGDRLVMR